MNFHAARFLAAIALLLFSTPAFADKVTLTIYSDPAGATVFGADQQPRGYTPLVVEYDLGRDFFKTGRCRALAPITARWASGAEASREWSLCGSEGKHQSVTLIRPDVPGREVDAFFALQLQQLAIEQQQAVAASRRQRWADVAASYAYRRAEMYRQRADITQRYLLANPRINCTSRVNGDAVETTCW